MALMLVRLVNCGIHIVFMVLDPNIWLYILSVIYPTYDMDSKWDKGQIKYT